MASAAVQTEVSFWAVGGASEHRVQRKLLLDSCRPDLASRSFALKGSLYDDDNPFRIPSWIPSVLESARRPEAIGCTAASASILGERDLLLVIGHLHDQEFDAFRSLHPQLPDANIWVMGGNSASFNLKSPIGHSIDGSICPLYGMREWSPVLELYPEVLKRMRAFQWGGFFTSRIPALIQEDKETGLASGAFYRQFNLHKILETGNMLSFEKEILQNAMNTDQTRRVLRQIDDSVKPDMPGREAITNLYRAYSDNGPWNDEALVASITNSLMQVIPRYTDLQVKEFDSFVAHLMVRSSAGLAEELTPAFHIQFVESCLRFLDGSTGTTSDTAFDAYVDVLRAGVAGRRIMVLHDLGLDPMSDDWLAAALLIRVAGLVTRADTSSAVAETSVLGATLPSTCSAHDKFLRIVLDIFACFDTRGDGMFSCAELKTLLRSLDKTTRMSPECIDMMLKAIDCKGDGWIHYETFCNWIFNGLSVTKDVDLASGQKTLKLTGESTLQIEAADTDGQTSGDDEDTDFGDLPLPSSNQVSPQSDACLHLRMALDVASSEGYCTVGTAARTVTDPDLASSQKIIEPDESSGELARKVLGQARTVTDPDLASSQKTIKAEASSTEFAITTSATLGASLGKAVLDARMCWTKAPPPWAKDALEGTVTLVSVAQDQNEEFRSYMEDGQKVVDPLRKRDCSNGDRWGFFAVYDGHGGREEVDYCESTLHNVVLDKLGDLPQEQDVAAALRESFLKVDGQLALLGAWKSGCTATVALVHRRNDAATLYVANVGDSRAVMMDCAGTAKRLSRDHRASDPSEAARVREEGGIIRYHRVGGALSVSRSLGDHYLKGSGVSSIPEVHSRDVVDDRALVIASDGLWDALEDADACEVLANCMDHAVARGGNQQEIAGYLQDRAASELVARAKERGSRDNILAMVVFF